MSVKTIITLVLLANLVLACQGGLLGFLAGAATCQSSCTAGYIACMGVACGGSGKLDEALSS